MEANLITCLVATMIHYSAIVGIYRVHTLYLTQRIMTAENIIILPLNN